MSIQYASLTILAGQQLSSTPIDTGGNQFPAMLFLPSNFTVADIEFYTSRASGGVYSPTTYMDGSAIISAPTTATTNILLDPQLMYACQFFKIRTSIVQVENTTFYIAMRPT